MTAVKDDTYQIVFVCYNCGHKQTESIPKGMTVHDSRCMLPCNHCGCATLIADKARIPQS